MCTVLRGRVSSDIYVFTSELYAQVTAGAVVTQSGAVLIDTLPFPPESRAMAAFVAQVCPAGVRYVVLTHYHADHTYGAYLFPAADVIAHANYQEMVASFGAPALEAAKVQEPELEEVTLRLPDITFEEGEIILQLGDKVLRMIHVPGHTRDSIMVYVESNRVLFAADTITPVPSIADGDVPALRSSLQKVADLPVENLVQGHGEVILRGEVKGIVKSSLVYLQRIEEKVAETIKKGKARETLLKVGIESCGLSRIPLNGLVQHIHTANLLSLYDRAVA
jgi:glyoxylase-like metal-dependent hydrolase (beta-lactamase superfamily II)